jgi:predicted nuclease with TOPRIM domain
MSDIKEIDRLREEIARTVKRKEALKQSIEAGKVPARNGLRELAELDAGLSVLDSQFKRLWDESHLYK